MGCGWDFANIPVRLRWASCARILLKIDFLVDILKFVHYLCAFGENCGVLLVCIILSSILGCLAYCLLSPRIVSLSYLNPIGRVTFIHYSGRCFAKHDIVLLLPSTIGDFPLSIVHLLQARQKKFNKNLLQIPHLGGGFSTMNFWNLAPFIV